MAFRKGYIFTNKDHPKKGIMSFILGILSIVTYVTAVYLSYLGGGESSERYGAAVFWHLFLCWWDYSSAFRHLWRKTDSSFFRCLASYLM